MSNLDHEFLSNAGWSVLLSIRNPSDKPVELKLAPESMIMKGKNGDRIATANMETGYIGAGILARKMDEGAKKITQNTGFDGEGADMSIVTEYFADKMLLKNRIASSFSQITLFNEEGQPSALLACSGQCTLKLPPGEVANLPIMFFAKEGTKPHSVTVEKVLFDNFGELVR